MGEDMALKKGVYTDKELNAIIGPELKSGIESCDYILRTNKLENVTEMAISLDEHDNSDNLEDGRPSNTLFTYYRKNDLILIMTPEKQDKTLELSKHWSVDSTPARNEAIMKRTYPVKSVKCNKICSNY